MTSDDRRQHLDPGGAAAIPAPTSSTPPPPPPWIQPGDHGSVRLNPDAALEQAFEYLLTAVIDRAGRDCDHPDPGAPIYDSVRGCATCSAQAVLQLMRGPTDAERALRAQLRAIATSGAPQPEPWAGGYGSAPTSHPHAGGPLAPDPGE